MLVLYIGFPILQLDNSWVCTGEVNSDVNIFVGVKKRNRENLIYAFAPSVYNRFKGFEPLN